MSNNVDKIEVAGIIKEVLPGTKFKVELDNKKIKTEIIAHLSGKMKKNNIKVIPGDYVTIEVSAYNLTEGRIVYRHTEVPKKQEENTNIKDNAQQDNSDMKEAQNN